jgi:hypothetical protein
MNEDPGKKKKNKTDSTVKKLSQPERAHIEELLKSALKDYAVKQTKVIKDKEQTAEKLISVITEYIGPFILIGYDLQGEPFNIINASSQLDADAIATAINKFIMSHSPI